MNLTEGDGVDPKRSRIAKRSRSGVSRRKAGGPRRHDRQATASILCYCAFGTTTLMEHKACRLVPGLDGVRFPGQMEMSQWGRSFFFLAPTCLRKLELHECNGSITAVRAHIRRSCPIERNIFLWYTSFVPVRRVGKSENVTLFALSLSSGECLK